MRPNPGGIFSSRWGVFPLLRVEDAFLRIWRKRRSPGQRPGLTRRRRLGRRRRHDRQELRAARRAIEGGDVVGLTVRSMVSLAMRRPRRQPAMRPTQAHLLTLSRLHQRLLPTTLMTNTPNLTDPACVMHTAHSVVKMVGVQEPSRAPPVSLLRAPVHTSFSRGGWPVPLVGSRLSVSRCA